MFSASPAVPCHNRAADTAMRAERMSHVQATICRRERLYPFWPSRSIPNAYVVI